MIFYLGKRYDRRSKKFEDGREGGCYDIRRYVFKGKGDIHEHLAYQFNITGEAEGIFYVEVKEGTLYVEPYEYFDRDAMFTCSAETLFKIAEGKTDPVLAFTLGKLKVEGNIDKALRLKELIDSKKR